MQDGCQRLEARQMLESLGADIVVLQECLDETLRKFSGIYSTRLFSNGGGDKTRGIGILCNEKWKALEERRLGRHILEVTLEGTTPFVLRGVWANKVSGAVIDYPEIVLDALKQSTAGDTKLPILTIGDFNTSTALDRDGRGPVSHHAINDTLEKERSASIYHKLKKKRFGEEPHGTLIRSEDEGDFHIDYAYVPLEWIERGAQLSFGRQDPWRRFSDHRPIILDVY